jgi:hypothetical protein
MNNDNICPKGKTYAFRDGSVSKPRHLFKTITRERLPRRSKRGDFHVIDRCEYCGQTRSYDCCVA